MVEQKRTDTHELLSRLRRVEGQIRGIQRIVEEERDCEAIVTQIMAARAAMDKVSLLIASHHIEQCLANPDGGANPERMRRMIEFFLKLSGPVPESLAEES